MKGIPSENLSKFYTQNNSFSYSSTISTHIAKEEKSAVFQIRKKKMIKNNQDHQRITFLNHLRLICYLKQQNLTNLCHTRTTSEKKGHLIDIKEIEAYIPEKLNLRFHYSTLLRYNTRTTNHQSASCLANLGNGLSTSSSSSIDIQFLVHPLGAPMYTLRMSPKCPVYRHCCYIAAQMPYRPLLVCWCRPIHF